MQRARELHVTSTWRDTSPLPAPFTDSLQHFPTFVLEPFIGAEKTQAAASERTEEPRAAGLSLHGSHAVWESDAFKEIQGVYLFKFDWF